MTGDEDAAPSRARLVVLSGPSGVGKSTVVRELRQHHRDVWVSVSTTSRFPRPAEVDGVHYWFVDRDEFSRRARDGEFLEWAEFAGNLYGTPADPVLRHLAAGDRVVLEIDLAGARQVHERLPEAPMVFLRPPSWDELVRRLSGRGTEPAETVARRLDVAKAELASQPAYALGMVNDDVGAVARRLVALLGP